MNTSFRHCSSCGVAKPFDQFYKDKKSGDGYSCHCKECIKARSRRWHHANKERASEQSRIYRETHREELLTKKRAYAKANRTQENERHAAWRNENREHVRRFSNSWSLQNLEKRREIARRHYHNHREKCLEASRNWRDKNPDAKRAIKLRRRARQRALASNFSAQDWRRCLEHWHHCCAVCGRQMNDIFGVRTLAADHWIPLASSICPGTIPANIIPLCQGVDGCNNEKATSDPEQWLIRKLGENQARKKMAEIQAYFARLADGSMPRQAGPYSCPRN